jgi:putative sterol carrier protein
MKITVVYGGRGLIEDPTLYVLEKMQMVMEELRMDVERINLYEVKNSISTLPALLKDTDAVVLAVSLEWFGIGGYVQEFLDACWLYGDKEKLQDMYMMPVVVATTSGEKDAELTLIKAWEILGGIPADGICAYVNDAVDFELNKDYGRLIEKKTEQLYRIVNQRMIVFPSSNSVIRNTVLKPKSLDLTPQESEQLSQFVANDSYVKQQKEDIEELAAMFKEMLDEDTEYGDADDAQTDTAAADLPIPSRGASFGLQEQTAEKPREDADSRASKQTVRAQAIPRDFKTRFRQHFHAEQGFAASYLLTITDKDEMLKITVDEEQLEITNAVSEEGDVIMRITSGVLNRITIGEMTFQRAFMSGEMKVKGDFKTLRTLDQIFRFS